MTTAATSPTATGTPVSKKRQAAAWPLVEAANRAFQDNRAQSALDLYRRAHETDPNNPLFNLKPNNNAGVRILAIVSVSGLLTMLFA